MAAVIAISLLIARRFLKPFGQAELGGPKVAKWVSAGIMVTLWVLYILFSSLEATGIIKVQF